MIDTKNYFGCMICGHELFYMPDKSLLAKCCLCGKEDITNVFCLNGHYVCNECHRKEILERVKTECNNSELTDPIKLALRIFDLPGLHMHGPEYHSIIPAILVTAYGNSVKSNNKEAVKEAITRGNAVPGGVCGSHGVCGACIGVGIAYSIIHQVTPYSEESRGNANGMTALALTAISKFGGPRCCKRDSITAIEIAIEHFGCFSHCEKSRYQCRQFPDNSMCIKNRCPYYPGYSAERG